MRQSIQCWIDGQRTGQNSMVERANDREVRPPTAEFSLGARVRRANTCLFRFDALSIVSVCVKPTDYLDNIGSTWPQRVKLTDDITRKPDQK